MQDEAQSRNEPDPVERDNQRGRTVLAIVGKAIQSGIKIPLQWNHRNVPCGEYKDTFSTYIGVVVRERVNINYAIWDEVPQEIQDEVYDFISVRTCTQF